MKLQFHGDSDEYVKKQEIINLDTLWLLQMNPVSND